MNSEVVEVAPGHAIAFRVHEHAQPNTIPLQGVKEQIEKSLKFSMASEQAVKTGKEVLAKMQGGALLESIAGENSLVVSTPGAVKRDDSSVAGSIVNRVFNLAKPVDNKIVADGVPMPDGSYALIELTKIIDGAEDISAEKITELSQRVNYGRREVC